MLILTTKLKLFSNVNSINIFIIYSATDNEKWRYYNDVCQTKIQEADQSEMNITTKQNKAWFFF